MEQILFQFDHQLSMADRDRLLVELVRRLSKRQLSLLANQIMPQLKCDILRHVPQEIAIQILSHLPVRSLCRLAQVSRAHRKIVDDNLIWKELARSHRFLTEQDDETSVVVYKRTSFIADMNVYRLDYQQVDMEVDVTSSSSSSSAGFQKQQQHSVCSMFAKRRARRNSAAFSYKRFFQANFVLHSNWNQGLHRHFSVAGPKQGIVTALQFDDDKVVVGTDNPAYGFIEVLDCQTGARRQILSGHQGGVWALEFLGNILVSGGCDRDLRVWDLSTGQCIHQLPGHTSTIRCLKIIDEQIVITGARDHTLRIWDIQEGQCMGVLRGHAGSIRCMAVHGDMVVSGSYDYSVRVWNWRTQKLVHVLDDHHAQVYSVAFDGRYICSGSLDADIRVWDAKTGECIWVLEGHDALVGHMQLRNQILTTGGSDGRVCIWDISSGDLLHMIVAHPNSVTTLQFDENRIISGGDDGIKMWDFRTGEFIRFLVSHGSGIWRLSFSPTKLVAAVQRNEVSTIEIFDYSVPLVPLNSGNTRSIASACVAIEPSSATSLPTPLLHTSKEIQKQPSLEYLQRHSLHHASPMNSNNSSNNNICMESGEFCPDPLSG